jgi:hypothetical protein
MNKLSLPRRDSNIEVIVPAEGNAAAPTSGTNWGWGAYTQITADVGYDFVLCGAHTGAMCNFPTGVATTDAIHWQIATGAAASEVNIADGQWAMYGQNHAGNPAGIWIGAAYTWRIDPILIASGTRLSVRYSQSYNGTLFYPAMYLFGYDSRSFSPSVGNMDSDRFLKGLKLSSHQVAPEAAAGNTVTAGGTAWTYGSWVEFIASASNDLLIKTLSLATTTGWKHVQAKIGIGGSGSEVAMSKIGFPGRTLTLHHIGTQELYRPLYVKKGERVAVQTACSAASFAAPFHMTWAELK